MSLRKTQYVVNNVQSMQFCSLCVCVCVCFYILFLPQYELPTYSTKPEGRRQNKVMPFPLVSLTFCVLPNVDNDFLLQLGAERVLFVLY